MSMHHSPHVILCDIVPFPLPLESCNTKKATLKTFSQGLACLCRAICVGEPSFTANMSDSIEQETHHYKTSVAMDTPRWTLCHPWELWIPVCQQRCTSADPGMAADLAQRAYYF